jgi:hypothetical protein
VDAEDRKIGKQLRTNSVFRIISGQPLTYFTTAALWISIIAKLHVKARIVGQILHKQLMCIRKQWSRTWVQTGPVKCEDTLGKLLLFQPTRWWRSSLPMTWSKRKPGAAIWSRTNSGPTGHLHPRSSPLPRVSAIQSASAIFKCILEVVSCEGVQHRLRYWLDHLSCVKISAI